MFVEINTSIIEEISIMHNIIIENIMCLNNSNFMFSLFLSFIIDLYNLNPLTANAIIAGIRKILGSKKLINVNIIPFCRPSTVTQTDIVYPRQNPLYIIIPNTTGIPIMVVPKNHIVTAKNIF